MTSGDILTDQKKYFSRAQMSAISALKLSLEGGWSNRTVWVLYSRRSYTVRYVPLVLVCSRRNIILSCI